MNEGALESIYYVTQTKGANYCYLALDPFGTSAVIPVDILPLPAEFNAKVRLIEVRIQATVLDEYSVKVDSDDDADAAEAAANTTADA